MAQVEQKKGFEVVYAGPDTFIREAFKGDATGNWYGTFTEARKAAIEMLRVPRNKYNDAIDRFKSLTKDESTTAFGPIGFVRGG